MIDKVKWFILRFSIIFTLLFSSIGFYLIVSGISHDQSCITAGRDGKGCDGQPVHWSFNPTLLAAGGTVLLLARLIYNQKDKV